MKNEFGSPLSMRNVSSRYSSPNATFRGPQKPTSNGRDRSAFMTLSVSV